jgi:hypothetical protein
VLLANPFIHLGFEGVLTMARFSADFQRTASTTASLGSIGAVSTTQARRGRIMDIMFGSEATPADAAILWTIQRYTAAGTSTAVTPQKLDPADAAFLGQAGENHTIEPTYTAGEIVLNLPLNQRATFRWVPSPGGEPVWPAQTANGFGIQTDTISTGTPVITATLHVDE